MPEVRIPAEECSSRPALKEVGPTSPQREGWGQSVHLASTSRSQRERNLTFYAFLRDLPEEGVFVSGLRSLENVFPGLVSH